MFDWLTIFDWVDKYELQTLSELMQERFLKKGDYLFNQWDDAIAMYVVKEWEMNLLKNDSYIWSMKKDSMFGEKAFLEWFDKRLLSAKAEEDSILIVMLYDSFEHFLKKHPTYKERMLKDFNEYNVEAKIEKW